MWQQYSFTVCPRNRLTLLLSAKYIPKRSGPADYPVECHLDP